MTSTTDIIDLRDENVQTLDELISAAFKNKDELPINDPQRKALSETINFLMTSRTELHIQTLKDGLKSTQLEAALLAMIKATADLKKEAAKMQDATTRISNENTVIGSATKVMNVLKLGG